MIDAIDITYYAIKYGFFIAIGMALGFWAFHQEPQRYVYDGSTLIGVCGGKPPATMPHSTNPDVDVTWYPECPR